MKLPQTERPLFFVGVGVIALLVPVMTTSWPYAIYMALRVVVSVALVYMAFLAYRRKQGIWGEALAVLALIFNPFIPVHFNRTVWAILDSVTIAFVATCLYTLCFRPQKARNGRGLGR